jgi:hypothetical protein
MTLIKTNLKSHKAFIKAYHKVEKNNENHARNVIIKI